MHPQILSRKIARKHFTQETVGYRFPLPFTGGVYGPDDSDLPQTPDGVPDVSVFGKARFAARVRRLDLMAFVTLTTLSPTMQSIVMDIFGDTKQADDEGQRSFDDTKHNFEREKALIDGICIAGFLEPRLVETQEEEEAANDERVVWVERIDDRDRKAYRDYVIRGEARAAQRLEPFSQDGLEDPAGDATLPTPTEAVASTGTTKSRSRLTRVS